MSLTAQAKTRLLLVSLIGFSILAIGGGWLTLKSIHRTRFDAQERKDGLAAAAIGDNTTVVNKLGGYLSRYPTDMEALTAYANARMKANVRPERAPNETAAVLRSILALNPTRHDEQRQLMLIFADEGYHTEALEQAVSLLKALPNDAQAAEMQVRENYALHKYDAAKKAADERLAIAPTDWAVQMERVDVMHQQGAKPEDIDAAVTKAIAGHEQEQGALFLKGYSARLNSDINTATAAYKAAATQPSTNTEVAINLVEQLDELNVHATAMTILGDVVKGGDPRLQLMWLRRLWEDGRFAEAVDFAAGGAAGNLDDTTSQGIYADSLRRLKKDNSAVMDKLAQRKDDPRAAAWVAIEKAQNEASQENWKLARSACESAMKGSNTDAEYALYFLANFEADLGDVNLAIDHWGRAAVQYRSHSWAMPLVQRAQAQLAQNLPNDALASIQVAWNRSPGQEYIAITMARVWYALSANGTPDQVKALNGLIDEIQKHDPNEEQTSMIRASMLAQAGQKDQAAVVIRGVLGKQPPPTEQALLGLLDISRKYSLGVEQECVAQYTKQFGVTWQAAMAEAMGDYQKTKTRDGGVKFLQDQLGSATAAQAPMFGMALATFREMTGDTGAAAEWKALGDKYPNDLVIQRAALASQAAYSDRDFYDRTINRVKTLAGEQVGYWKLARARWLLDGPPSSQANTDAIQLLTDYLKADPKSVPALLLASDAKARSGDLNGAAEMMTKAKQLDPTSSAMSLSLAQMLQIRGDFDEARTQLEQAANDQKATPEFRDHTAMLLANQGDLAKAISILEPLVAGPNATELMKLHLAALYCRIKQFDKAQVIADGLMKTPGARAIVLSAQIQMFQRQPEAADKVLEGLKSVNITPEEQEMTLGEFYATFSRMDLALQHYKSATQPAPQDAGPWLALIDIEVSQGNAAEVPGIVDEALKHVTDKTVLTELQKQNDLLGHFGTSRTEKQLLADLIKNPTDDNPAVKVMRVVIPLEKGDAGPSEILQKLQQLSVDLPRYLPAQTGLTESQLRYGRCEDAIQSANRAAAAFPTDPWPAQLAEHALALTGHWDEALAAAKTWRERVIGDTLNVDMAIAEIQLHLHDADGALATLKPYDAAPELEPDQQWQIKLTEGRAMLLQNKPDEAANMLWPIVQKTPADRDTWETFVMYLPAAQCEQWLQKTSALVESEPGSERQQIVLARDWDYLARHLNKKEYAQQAREKVSKLEAVPAIAGYAAFATGTFLEEDGDFAGAQAAYHRAIDKQHDLTDAKNNLAELLANHGGDMKEAVSLAQECVKDSPNDAAYFDTLADILGKSKDFDGALAAIKRATELEPDNAKWRVHQAKLMAEAGKPDRAKLEIAELDLMTPGVKSLPQSYRDELEALRKQLSAPSVTAAH